MSWGKNFLFLIFRFNLRNTIQYKISTGYEIWNWFEFEQQIKANYNNNNIYSFDTIITKQAQNEENKKYII